jgi:hypothetical protein
MLWVRLKIAMLWVPDGTLGFGSRFRRLRAFLFTPGVMVANVLYHLTSSHNLIASDAPPSIDGSEVSRHTGNAIRKIKTSP